MVQIGSRQQEGGEEIRQFYGGYITEKIEN